MHDNTNGQGGTMYKLYKLALIDELMNVPYPPFSLTHNLAFHPEIAGIIEK